MEKQNNTGLYLIIGAVILGVLVLCCCACFFLFGFSSFISSSTTTYDNSSTVSYDEVDLDVELIRIEDETEDTITLYIEVKNKGDYLAIPGEYMYLETKGSKGTSSSYPINTEGLELEETDFDWEFLSVGETERGYITFNKSDKVDKVDSLRLIITDGRGGVLQRIQIARG